MNRNDKPCKTGGILYTTLDYLMSSFKEKIERHAHKQESGAHV